MRLTGLLAITALGLIYVAANKVVQQVLQQSTWQLTSRLSPLLELHKSLIEFSSISGAEREVSDFLKAYLRDQGLTVETQTVEGDRRNVFAYAGKSRKTRVLVTSHIDTVPPYWPYERKGDEIWGRGSVDAKGSVAAQVIAVQSLLDDGVIADGDVSLLFVVGEENSGLGMQVANGLGLSWETVIFGEPTELKLASGHKGGAGFVISARGKAGHSGYPELGKNAIDILVKGLAALQTIEFPSSEEFGNTTLNIGSIQGGVAPNVIPQDASATGLIRIAAGSPEDLRALVEKTVHEASPELEINWRGGRGPVPIDHDIEGRDTNQLMVQALLTGAQASRLLS